MKTTIYLLLFVLLTTTLPSCKFLSKDKEIVLVKAVPGEELNIARKNGKQGFVNSKGEWVIAPQFELCYPFVDGFALVSPLKDQYVLIDIEGKQLPIPAGYSPSTFAGGLAPVKKDGKTGFIDKTGKLVVPAIYDEWSLPDEGMHIATRQGKSFYIDSTGKVLSGDGYDDAGGFSEGLGCVKIGDKHGYINKAGEVVIAPKYDFAVPFHEGLAEVGLNEMVGFIDKTGKEVIPLSRGHIGWIFCKGTTWFFVGEGKERKYGMIDKTGKEIVPAKYDRVEEIIIDAGRNKMGAWRTYIGNKKGMVDGSIVIEPAFDLLEPFSEGLAVAGNQTDKGILTGYIDSTGKWAIQPTYFGANDFSSGMAAVTLSTDQGRLWGYIDKTGKMVIQPKYFDAGAFKGNHAFVNLGLFDAIIDKTGKEKSL